MATDEIRLRDLYTNPDTRVPVCLCLDTSGSMRSVEGDSGPTGKYIEVDGRRYRVVRQKEGGAPLKTRLQILQEGLDLLYNTIFENEVARYSAELSIVTFDDTAKMLTDFSRVEYDNVREVVPQLRTGNKTSLGAGVNLALKLLEKRKKEYRNNGVDYYQPWLVIMTDGEDNGDPEELRLAQEKIRVMTESNKLSVYPFIIGKEGKETLATLSPRQEPLEITHIRQVTGLFKWLSASIGTMSSSVLSESSGISINQLTVTQWDSTLT